MTARLDGASSARGFSTRLTTSYNLPFDPGTGLPSSTPYAEMPGPSTTCVARTEHWVLSKTSISCLRHGTFGVNNVIRQQDREGLVAHQFTRSEDGMAETQRFFLSHIRDVDQVGNLADNL